MNKQIKAQYDFLFMGKDEGNFVKNYAYDLGDTNEHDGKIFINLEIQQNSFDAEKVGEVIFDNVRKVFFADLENDPYLRFEDALKEVNRSLNALKQERNSDFLGKLNVIIAAVVGDNLYVTQCGEAEAYLIRKRFVTTISEGLQEESAKDIFNNIASGELETGDFLLLSSTRLIRYISKTDLAKKVNNQLEVTLAAIKDTLDAEVLNKIALIGINIVHYDQKAGQSSDNSQESSGKLVHMVEKEEAYFKNNDSKSSNGFAIGSISVEDLKKKATEFYRKGRIKIDVLLSKNDFSSEKSPTRLGNRRNLSDTLSIGNWSKDKLIIAIIVLILVLTFGVWWLKAKADQDQKVKDMANELVVIQEDINSAVTNSSLDKDMAGKILNDAEQKAIVIYNSGSYKAKARELLDQILDTRDKLDGVIHPKVTQVVDLTKKRTNVKALGLVILKGKIFAYEYNALYPILLDKLEDPLNIDDNEKVVSAVNYDDKDSILFYTETGKIIEYKDGRMNFISTSDQGGFKKGALQIQSYLNKIYLLDPLNNQIWRYTRRRDAFDGVQPYVVGADLKNAISLAIDASIYVLNNDGFITKIFQGSKQDFSIKKQPVKALSSPVKIFTQPNIPQVYILEPSENRVMIYLKDDKNGGATYTGQYVFDDLKGIKDIGIDKDSNTMYLLDNTSVYKITL